MTATSAAVTRMLAAREAQGLPPTVTDPAVLDRVAAVLGGRPTLPAAAEAAAPAVVP